MFYGVTRYSLYSPGSHSWKTSKNGAFKTQEEYSEYLFSEKRLNLRADIFINKALPSLAMMAKEFDYEHFVLYSALLPERHKELLLLAANEYPFLKTVEWNEVVRGTGMEEVVPLIEADLATKCTPDGDSEPVIWFRLDDDDVLATDYLSHLEKYRTLNNVGMAISFGLGLTGYKTDRHLVSLREIYHPKSAQGMAFVSEFDPKTGRLSITKPGPHHGIDKVMPTIVDSREHMFFQVRHGDQDSTLNETPYERIAASLSRLDKLPTIRTSEDMKIKWPTLITDMINGEPQLHEECSNGSNSLKLEETSIFSFALDSRIKAGLVEFEFEYESSSRLQGGFAVVTYDLDGVDAADLSGLGLRASTVFGSSRQAWSKSSKGVIRHSFLLPTGASAASITLRGTNKQGSDVFIRLRKPRVIPIDRW